MGGRAAAVRQVWRDQVQLAAKVGDSCTQGLGKESASQLCVEEEEKEEEEGQGVEYSPLLFHHVHSNQAPSLQPHPATAQVSRVPVDHKQTKTRKTKKK
jgi:hypothetical protein